MDNNLYHIHQLSSTTPTVYLTKSNGAGPIIKALRERQNSDPRPFSRSSSVTSSTSSRNGEGEDTAAGNTAMTPFSSLLALYGQMVSTMADVR